MTEFDYTVTCIFRAAINSKNPHQEKSSTIACIASCKLWLYLVVLIKQLRAVDFLALKKYVRHSFNRVDVFQRVSIHQH